MNKKGFTLIELAAVILVLAILALIATPIVMNTIENVRKGAAERSADHYINAINTTAAMDGIANGLLEDGIYKVIENGNLCKYFYYDEEGELTKSNTDCSTTPSLVVDVKGDMPLVGSGIEIKDGQVLKESSLVKFNNYEVSYTEGIAKAQNYTSLEDVCTLVEGKANDVGSQYSCDLGDGTKNFYILEAGTLGKPATLILGGNYDSIKLTWCENASTFDNTCAADGLADKLDEIADAWTNLDATHVGLPTANQILKASDLPENMSTSTNGIRPIKNWLHAASEQPYWTSTPATDWPEYNPNDGIQDANDAESAIVISAKWVYKNTANQTAGVRPVVKLAVDIFADSSN